MKTILQEIIDKYYQSSIYRCEFTEWFIENKDILIEKEKEQLEIAKKEGYDFAMKEAVKEIQKNYKPMKPYLRYL